MIQKLKDKKKALQEALQQKTLQMQNAENVKNQITTEVIELQGKLKMIDELIKEKEESSDVSQESK